MPETHPVPVVPPRPPAPCPGTGRPGLALDSRSFDTLRDDAVAAGLHVRSKAREWVVEGHGTRVRVRRTRAPSAFVAGIGGPDVRLTVAGAYARLGLSPGRELSAREVFLMGCAMGLLYRAEPYRNHFTVHPGNEDHETWQGLRLRGFAAGHRMGESTLWCFRVTDAGAEAYGVVLKDEDRVVGVTD